MRGLKVPKAPQRTRPSALRRGDLSTSEHRLEFFVFGRYKGLPNCGWIVTLRHDERGSLHYLLKAQIHRPANTVSVSPLLTDLRFGPGVDPRDVLAVPPEDQSRQQEHQHQCPAIAHQQHPDNR